jgi:hypothetical protein
MYHDMSLYESDLDGYGTPKRRHEMFHDKFLRWSGLGRVQDIAHVLSFTIPS